MTERVYTDRINIYNLELYAYHGVFPEEQKLGQKFLIDASLYLDTRQAGQNDDIHASVDYGFICRFITKYLQEHTFELLEAAAEQLAQALLLKLPKIRAVDLEIKKPWAPIGLPIETASVAISRRWHTVYLSIGSNMGDRQAFLDYGVRRLEQAPFIKDIRVSKILETEPYGYTDQDAFLNGAVELQTLCTPHELLTLIHKIEADAGRERKIHWGPRSLDLDILFYDDWILEQPDLLVPHPDMENRMFVLEPLSELCPGKVHPVLQKTVLALKRDLETT